MNRITKNITKNSKLVHKINNLNLMRCRLIGRNKICNPICNPRFAMKEHREKINSRKQNISYTKYTNKCFFNTASKYSTKLSRMFGTNTIGSKYSIKQSQSRKYKWVQYDDIKIGDVISSHDDFKLYKIIGKHITEEIYGETRADAVALSDKTNHYTVMHEYLEGVDYVTALQIYTNKKDHTQQVSNFINLSMLIKRNTTIFSKGITRAQRHLVVDENNPGKYFHRQISDLEIGNKIYRPDGVFEIVRKENVSSMDYGGAKFEYDYWVAKHLILNKEIEIGGLLPLVLNPMFVLLDE